MKICWAVKFDGPPGEWIGRSVYLLTYDGVAALETIGIAIDYNRIMVDTPQLQRDSSLVRIPDSRSDFLRVRLPRGGMFSLVERGGLTEMASRFWRGRDFHSDIFQMALKFSGLERLPFHWSALNNYFLGEVIE